MLASHRAGLFFQGSGWVPSGCRAWRGRGHTQGAQLRIRGCRQGGHKAQEEVGCGGEDAREQGALFLWFTCSPVALLDHVSSAF